jgi:hypothetical protein
MGPGPREDGEDRHLWANHLGPYLLTRLLLPAFPKDGTGRVVNVASRSHYWGSVTVRRGDEVRDGGRSSSSKGGAGSGSSGAASGSSSSSGPWKFDRQPRSWFSQYARSKLCNVVSRSIRFERLGTMSSPAQSPFPPTHPTNKQTDQPPSLNRQLFTHELQRRYGPAPAAGSSATKPPKFRVIAASVSPGLVATSIFGGLPWPLQLLAPPVKLLARTPAQGAEAAVWAAAAEEVDGTREYLFVRKCKPLAPLVGGWAVRCVGCEARPFQHQSPLPCLTPRLSAPSRPGASPDPAGRSAGRRPVARRVGGERGRGGRRRRQRRRGLAGGWRPAVGVAAGGGVDQRAPGRPHAAPPHHCLPA